MDRFPPDRIRTVQPLSAARKDHSRLYLNPRFPSHSIVLAFVIGSIVATWSRINMPIRISSDLTKQVQATLNLLSGDGFGIQTLFERNFSGLEIAVAPLTHFPPTFSLLLLGLMKAGLPLVFSLKLIYSFATVLGWSLWGLVFHLTVMNSVNINRYCSWLLLLSLILTGFMYPQAYTLAWNGTDLLLWAAIPLFVLLGRRIALTKGSKQKLLYLLLGILIGIMYSIRYASLFLVPALIIFTILERPPLKSWIYAFPGPFISYFSIAIYKKIVADDAFGYWKFSLSSFLNPTLIAEKLRLVLTSIDVVADNITMIMFGPSPFMRNPPAMLVLLVVASMAAYSCLYCAVKRQDETASPSTGNFFHIFNLFTALLIGLLLILFTSFFIASTNQFLFFTDSRFYQPLFPLLLLLSLAVVATATPHLSGSASSQRQGLIIKFVSYPAYSLAILCFGLALLISFHTLGSSPTRLASLRMIRGQEYSLIQNASIHNLIPRDPASVQHLTNLMAANRDHVALNFAEDLDFGFTLDPQVRRRFVTATSAFEIWPRNIWIGHDETEAKGVYFVFGNEKNCPSYCFADSGIEVPFARSIPDFKLVYSNPRERIQIFEADLPVNNRKG